ncbi:MAG: molybdopterin-dependent oxidoreductase, partial [Dehalococcoidales bacterium]|nr:molybdopterin-dependent oxidoreductase [Dehalococcoidales bacterium]
VAEHGLSFFGLLNFFIGVPLGELTADLGDDHQGVGLTIGQPFVGCSADNWYYADLILVWGGNPSYTNISNYHWITEARYNGTKIVVVSPDYSASAVQADLWVPVNIGSDTALALSIAHVIIRNNLHKEDFVREQTDLPFLVRTDNHRYLREQDMKREGREDAFYLYDRRQRKVVEAPRHSLALAGIEPSLEGEYEINTSKGKVKVKPLFELLKEHLRDYSPDKVSPIVGVAPNVIEGLAKDIGQAKGVVNVSTFNWGKFYHGDLIERAIMLVFALCGHMGKRGATYSGFTGISVDSNIGGLEVRGDQLLRSMAGSDPNYAKWKADGYTDTMILMERAKQPYARGAVSATSLYYYYHAGLLDLSLKNNSWDPYLKRPVADYLKEALDKGWQFVVPKPDKEPRAIFQMGGSFLRRARSTDQIIQNLLPKLELLVHVDFRWTSSALYADYVLPACGWWEKTTVLPVVKQECPFDWVSNKVVEPFYETKTEWEIGCLFAKKIQERAKQRGILTFAAADGTQQRLDNVYDRVTNYGEYTEDDDEAVARDFYTNAENVEQIDWEEFKAKGLVPLTGVGLGSRGVGNACDVSPGEPMIPLTWHTDKKEPYPTLTRRMQFYVDHDWYLELGEALPAHKEDPKVAGDYPLRVTGGHARWSIHSIHVDEPILLRLQRGEPVIFMNKKDVRVRGIQDGDRVEVFNDRASFRPIVVASAAVKPGQILIYHAWENFQFPDWKHFKSVMASALNPVELAGGYGHIRPGPGLFYPGLNDRETRVEVRKAPN